MSADALVGAHRCDRAARAANSSMLTLWPDPLVSSACINAVLTRRRSASACAANAVSVLSSLFSHELHCEVGRADNQDNRSRRLHPPTLRRTETGFQGRTTSLFESLVYGCHQFGGAALLGRQEHLFQLPIIISHSAKQRACREFTEQLFSNERTSFSSSSRRSERQFPGEVFLCVPVGSFIICLRPFSGQSHFCRA